MARRRFDVTYASGLVAGVLAGIFNPDVTFHLAPVLVGILFPLGHRIRSGRLSPTAAAATMVGAMINVGLATGALWPADRSRGRRCCRWAEPPWRRSPLGRQRRWQEGAVLATLDIRFPGEQG